MIIKTVLPSKVMIVRQAKLSFERDSQQNAINYLIEKLGGFVKLRSEIKVILMIILSVACLALRLLPIFTF